MKKLFFFFLLLSFCVFPQSLSLRDADNQYDYVIITVPEFVAASEGFKNHKENLRGFKVLVTDTSAIFAGFDSSMTEEENIRDFISYAGTFWKEPQPKYFLIVGDLDKVPNKLIVNEYPEYGFDSVRTDYYYSLNKYQEDELIDFYVGRVSACNEIEVQDYFDKVIAYESDPNVHSWNNKVLFVADDGATPDRNEGDLWESMALRLGDILPHNFNPEYFFEADTSVYFGNKDSVINYINNEGASSIFFIGHVEDSIFTHERFLELDDIDLFNNNNPFFAYFIRQSFSSSNNQSMLNKLIVSKYGALSGYSSVGIVYANMNYEILRKFLSFLYSNNHLTLGESHASAQIVYKNISMIDQYNIFGDPSLKLKFDVLAPVDPDINIVKEYLLEQNYPNPFNPSTKIKFSLPAEGNVQIDIYDMLGNKIETLVNDFYSAGTHAINFNAVNYSSGVYFYSIKSGNYFKTMKMVLMK